MGTIAEFVFGQKDEVDETPRSHLRSADFEYVQRINDDGPLVVEPDDVTQFKRASFDNRKLEREIARLTNRKTNTQKTLETYDAETAEIMRLREVERKGLLEEIKTVESQITRKVDIGAMWLASIGGGARLQNKPPAVPVIEGDVK